ncbi:MULTISPECIES: autotransporter assembly complex family protein [unclassified Phenylobacterium]|uniref:autotransporter assembly complex protein TamA n=1 Tax=unclassified Phenylobacterium TaxID=2640670 RepID=UPI0018D207AE|nr:MULTISPECIES: BamA/TamA family outer membrane protein [unclassified Phenylobacterium]
MFDAPLRSLETLETATPAELGPAEPGTGAAEVPYTVALAGLSDRGLEREFRELSALYADRDRRAAAAQVRLRAEADIDLLERILRAQGYYDAAVTVAFDPPTGRTDALDVQLTAAAGQRYALGDIRITGSPPAPTQIAREALTVNTGDPLVATAVELAEANVALRLPQEGYPFAEIGRRDVALDGATLRADYTLPLSAGPLSVFGGFRPAGEPVFDAEHVSVLARFKPGELYDSRRVEDLRQALVSTGLLSVVALEPVRTARPASGGAEIVDLRVRQTPAPPRSVSATAGYGTGEGFKVTGAWTHRNLFPPEGALSVRGVAGTQEQRAGISFRRSNAGKRDRTLLATAEASRETREAYDARSVALSAGVSRASTPLWQKRWTYAYGAELIATNETRFDDASGARPRETFVIAALPLQLGYDTSDDLLDPTRGFRLTGRLSPEVSYRDRASPYGRSLIDTSAYVPAGSRLVLAGRARLGTIAGISRDEVAPSRRFYAGGGGSVRGFGYQDLGPRDVNGDPRGGRSLVEFSVEARFRRGNLGIVPFVDAGQVYSASSPRFDDLRVGVGLGGRYYTPFGPLRVDVATPLDRRKGDPRVAVYISLGQAF